jgi:uncharacterized CHY-type Zn-finger protein
VVDGERGLAEFNSFPSNANAARSLSSTNSTHVTVSWSRTNNNQLDAIADTMFPGWYSTYTCRLAARPNLWGSFDLADRAAAFDNMICGICRSGSTLPRSNYRACNTTGQCFQVINARHFAQKMQAENAIIGRIISDGNFMQEPTGPGPQPSMPQLLTKESKVSKQPRCQLTAHQPAPARQTYPKFLLRREIWNDCTLT